MSIIIISFKNVLKYELGYLSINLISLLSGFFLATVLSTMPVQTGDWSIIAASIIVTCNEIISQVIYKNKKYKLNLLNIVNYIKIGIIYGLFVDAFKLGS